MEDEPEEVHLCHFRLRGKAVVRCQLDTITQVVWHFAFDVRSCLWKILDDEF